MILPTPSSSYCFSLLLLKNHDSTVAFAFSGTLRWWFLTLDNPAQPTIYKKRQELSSLKMWIVYNPHANFQIPCFFLQTCTDLIKFYNGFLHYPLETLDSKAHWPKPNGIYHILLCTRAGSSLRLSAFWCQRFSDQPPWLTLPPSNYHQ